MQQSNFDPETMGGPGAPETMGGPGVPETMGGPGAPETMGGPGAPETMGGPGVPETMGGPGVPETMGGPGAPETMGGPGIPTNPLDFGTFQAASSKTLEETLTNPNNATVIWNVSITYIPAGTSWLSLSSSSGTIPPLGQQDLFVTANTSALAPGTYDATLTFSGNFSPDKQVSVTLVVQ